MLFKAVDREIIATTSLAFTHFLNIPTDAWVMRDCHSPIDSLPPSFLADSQALLFLEIRIQGNGKRVKGQPYYETINFEVFPCSAPPPFFFLRSLAFSSTSREKCRRAAPMDQTLRSDSTACILYNFFFGTRVCKKCVTMMSLA